MNCIKLVVFHDVLYHVFPALCIHEDAPLGFLT